MSELITEKMEAIRADWEQQFTNLYCKKDFVHQLDIARTAASDRKPQVLSKLAAMYNAVGIACEYGKPLAYYESLFPQLQVAESVEDINNRIINTMFALYVQYPKPEEFMQRIVNRLDPETMLSGSLELRILRRFLQTVNVKENKKYFSKILGNKVAAEGIESIDKFALTSCTSPRARSVSSSEADTVTLPPCRVSVRSEPSVKVCCCPCVREIRSGRVRSVCCMGEK